MASSYTVRNFKNKELKICQYCDYCDKFLETKEATVDHILPRFLGGTSDKKNLALCCKECNQKKGNKLLKDSGLKLIRKRY